MPWAAAAAAVVGGAISSDASRHAANTQADAARDAQAANERMFDKNVELQKPWREAGIGALGDLTKGIGPGGEFSQGFHFSNDDPSYKFRFDQGRDALEGSAASRGMLLSGGMLKSLVDYGQGAASQEYGSAYNRWNNDVTNRFNRLASVAGIGQTATRDVTQAGTSLAGANGELGLQGANARAAGTVGQANAVTGTLSGLGNWWQQTRGGSTGSPWAPSSGGSNRGSSFGTPGLDDFYYGNGSITGD